MVRTPLILGINDTDKEMLHKDSFLQSFCLVLYLTKTNQKIEYEKSIATTLYYTTDQFLL
jgi:hypothetical protein